MTKDGERNESAMKTQVAGTNDFSIESKYSLVTSGYVDDEYLRHFIVGKCPRRRSPIINRGYYVRHRAIEFAFRESRSKIANRNVILSLGSGFDTSALRLCCENTFFIELDYSPVCRRKAAILLGNDLLGGDEIIEDNSSPDDDDIGDNGDVCLILRTKRYMLLGGDLRRSRSIAEWFDSNRHILQQFVFCSPIFGSTCNADREAIQFILFNECSLCYIEQRFADSLICAIIESLTKIFSEINQISFTYIGYEMFRSENCRNDFGDFLLDHFSSLGAGILTFIDEAEIEYRFRRRLHFDSVQIINMKNFWREILNQDFGERERIRSLEPFDEWEELDNVCASYCLTIASRITNRIKENRRRSTEESASTQNNNIQIDHQHNQNHKLRIELAQTFSNLLPVFGHSSCYDQSQNRVTIFGGFGIEPRTSSSSSSRAHRRFSNIIELKFNNHRINLDCDQQKSNISASVHSIAPNNSSQSSCINRLHGQVIDLGDSRYLLSGGRSSPSTIRPNILLEIDPNRKTFTVRDEPELNPVSSRSSTPAYRHVCRRFGRAADQFIQFGGITATSNSFGDQISPNPGSILICDSSTFRWSTHRVDRLAADLHSIGCVEFGENCILFYGGIDSWGNFSESNSALRILDRRDCRRLIEYRLRTPLESRYSHRLSSLDDNRIASIGGIGARRIENTITLFDIRALDVIGVEPLPSPARPDMLMAHNFTTESIEVGKGKMIGLIGGGGNCFSFGTHFNPVLLYDLSIC